jgi:peptidoglycan hydrolase CwlO-like protein
MTQLLIPLTQSVAGAVITIIALLLVAAIIGYVTAWFYAKSVYTPIIKGLEEEKADLLKQVAGLKDDVRKLEKENDGLKEKTGELEKTLAEKDNLIKNLRKKTKEKEV